MSIGFQTFLVYPFRVVFARGFECNVTRLDSR